MANTLVSIIGSSLSDFFQFCESQNNEIKATELNDLFNRYFSTNCTGVTKKTSNTDSNTSVSPAPAKKATTKEGARKASGKLAKPRSEQTSLASYDLTDNNVVKSIKLVELKSYAEERGLNKNGTKAQVIENILKYEKEQNDSPAEIEDVSEDTNIKVKKPKIKGNKLCEPATRHKIDIIERHDIRMIWYRDDDDELYLVIDDNDVIVGWVSCDDEQITEEGDSINVRALQKKHCEMARFMDMEFELPDNLDA